MNNLPDLTFLKCGGSLITDKTRPLTARQDIITRIATEIAASRDQHPELHLLIGHGSGSFGHAIASQYQTQDGVHGAAAWQGFTEVWAAARALNQIFIEALFAARLPVVAFPPSAGVLAADKSLQSWDIRPLRQALLHGLIPVVQGDVIFDMTLGGTIFSTEQVFQFLAQELRPGRILLAGADAGVYHNPSRPEDVIEHITPASYAKIKPKLSGARATDVTGGMLVKVKLMLSLVQANPALEVRIFSGVTPGNLQKALAGEPVGTLITT